MTSTRPMTRKATALVAGATLHALSLAVFGLLLLWVFAIYVGEIGRSSGLPVFATLAGAISLRYVALYHPFERTATRLVAAAPLAALTAGVGVYAVVGLLGTVTVDGLTRPFDAAQPPMTTEAFLPEWWIAGILVPSGALALLGLVLTRDRDPYPTATSLRTVARSPVAFATGCAVLGLWAVLFVGFGVQRLVVIAPIFEELLKFGVALLIGASLFGRSLTARLGVALLVGASFGWVEHAVTYSTEPDSIYAFRTAFHGVTTMLSVATYTYFESRELDSFRWLAPAFPIALHFFHNTFVLLSAILSVVVFGSQSLTLPLVYGSTAIAIATVLLVLTVARHTIVESIHEPLRFVLSDLV